MKKKGVRTVEDLGGEVEEMGRGVIVKGWGRMVLVRAECGRCEMNRRCG